MLLSIHQPHFFPWLGYFHKIINSDCFVYLDNVQYRKNYFQNRSQIKNVNGQALWFTVPVSNSSLDTPICNTTIAPVFQPQKLIKTLHSCYSKTPFYKELSPAIFEILTDSYNNLSTLNFKSIQYVLSILELNRPYYVSSELDIASEDPNERILDICKRLGATKYLAGKGGANYMNLDLFSKNNIEILWQRFNPSDYQYNQVNGTFLPGLSILDALFNIGPVKTKNILSGKHE